MSEQASNACPVCGNMENEPFFDLRDVPVHCNVLHSSHDAALAAPRGNMQLCFCSNCGHMWNTAFDASLTTYTQTYENSLHFSPHFQKYAEGLAKDLIGRYGLHNKTIIEVGCGNGDFLKLMCDIGTNKGVGFDTSYQENVAEKPTRDERFTVVQDFYSDKYSQYKPDFICCRHVLEHIGTPAEFVAALRRAVPPACPAYFEVPNALHTLKDFGIWDLIYEHCSYFTAHSLERLFVSHDFGITRLEEKYDGQFLGIELGLQRERVKTGLSIEEIAKLVSRFGGNYNDKTERWKRALEQLRKDRKRVVVWGSGSKGVTFLNALRPDIEYIVDLNPRKRGMFVPGTGQQVVAPEFLRKYRPDAVIIMNPVYKKEIGDTLRRMGLAASTIVA